MKRASMYHHGNFSQGQELGSDVVCLGNTRYIPLIRLIVAILKWPIPLADSVELAISRRICHLLENGPFLSTLCTLKIRGIGHNSKELARGIGHFKIATFSKGVQRIVFLLGMQLKFSDIYLVPQPKFLLLFFLFFHAWIANFLASNCQPGYQLLLLVLKNQYHGDFPDFLDSPHFHLHYCLKMNCCSIVLVSA